MHKSCNVIALLCSKTSSQHAHGGATEPWWSHLSPKDPQDFFIRCQLHNAADVPGCAADRWTGEQIITSNYLYIKLFEAEEARGEATNILYYYKYMYTHTHIDIYSCNYCIIYIYTRGRTPFYLPRPTLSVCCNYLFLIFTTLCDRS